MTDPQRQLVRRFFDGLTSGAFDADLFTYDVTCWTTASGKMDAAQYRVVPLMLQRVFPEGIAFHIDTIIAEGDRAAAEVRSEARSTATRSIPMIMSSSFPSVATASRQWPNISIRCAYPEHWAPA